MNTTMSFRLAFRKIFRKGEHTATRVISLAMGLSFSLLLLSEVLYYFSFEGFYPNISQLYLVTTQFRMDKNSEKSDETWSVSGAVAPGMKEEIPEVVAASRLTSVGSLFFYGSSGKSYKATTSFADEFFFDLLPRPMISGNPKEILSRPMTCMISDKIADKMGGNVLGELIEFKEFPGKKLSIGGVFKALPENTLHKYDILISLGSIGEFMWDGSLNWLGNDRYFAVVKLSPGTDPAALAPAIRKMQEKHQDIVNIEAKNPGMLLKYELKPLQSLMPNSAKDMILILSVIAFAVLAISLLNYLLLTLSSLINQTKSSAIHKCYGAAKQNIIKNIFVETFVIFIISLIVSFSIILLLKPLFEQQVGHALSSVFSAVVVIPLLALIVLILCLISYLPGHFFARIPVASAFRGYRQGGTRWKLGLLALQFFGSSFILMVLLVVSFQYGKMRETDHGYNPKGVYFHSTSGINVEKIPALLQQIRALPDVAKAGYGTCLPTESASGNNVFAPEGQELFNLADLYYIDENYLSILGIPIVGGDEFNPEKSVFNDVLISKKGADKLMLYSNWRDGIIGKNIEVSEHNNIAPSTIRGIFPDFIIGSISRFDVRPSAFFYIPENNFVQTVKKMGADCYILVKAKAGNHAGIVKQLDEVFNSVLLYKDANTQSLEARVEYNYSAEKGFRNAMMVGSIVIVIVTVIGIVGYTNNEVSRRKKDLAIRKINGATLGNILRMFVTDIERVAIPAVVIGVAASWPLSNLWMQNFAFKYMPHWAMFVLCAIVISVLIASVAIVNYLKIGNQNPAESLKCE